MNKHIITRKIAPYLLILPLILLLLCLFVGLSTGFMQSLGYMPGFGVEEITLEHYEKVLTSESLLESIGLSLYAALAASLITAVLSILLAWCLVTTSKGKGIVFTLTKLPMLVPYSVCALMIIFLFSQSGFLPRLLETIGIQDAANLFSQILYWPNSIGVIIVFVFHATSFFTYMVVGTMAQISDRLGEASLNLGASRWQTFGRVILPHCMPIIRNTYILIFVIFFGSYEVPLLVGSAMKKFVSVQAYLDYVNFNFLVYRPEAMVLNILMLAIAALIVLAIYLWDVHDRKKRGVV